MAGAVDGWLSQLSWTEFSSSDFEPWRRLRCAARARARTSVLCAWHPT